MKILKDGDLERLRPWYTKYQWTCTNCGCLFMLEEKDEIRHETCSQWDPCDEWSCTCPYCGRYVKINEPYSRHPYE